MSSHKELLVSNEDTNFLFQYMANGTDLVFANSVTFRIRMERFCKFTN